MLYFIPMGKPTSLLSGVVATLLLFFFYQPFHYRGDVSEGVLSVVAQFHIIYSSSQQG